MGDWTFFSNHGHVLVCLARNSDARLRDVADQVGITERAVQKIVRDLQDEGYLEVTKQGRCNRYRINNRKALRHQLQAGITVGQLLGLMTRQNAPARQADRQPEPAKKAPEPGKAEAEPESTVPVEKAPEEKTPAEDVTSPPDPPRQSPEEDGKGSAPDLEQGQLF